MITNIGDLTLKQVVVGGIVGEDVSQARDHGVEVARFLVLAQRLREKLVRRRAECLLYLTIKQK